MKKILVIVTISLLFASKVLAGCKSDIEFKWWKTTNDRIGVEFENKGSKHIRITRIYIKDSDGDTINDWKPRSWRSGNPSKGYFVSPKEKKTNTYFQMANAHKYGKRAGWECTYQKPYEKSFGDKLDDATDSIGSTIKSWFSDDD